MLTTLQGSPYTWPVFQPFYKYQFWPIQSLDLSLDEPVHWPQESPLYCIFMTFFGAETQVGLELSCGNSLVVHCLGLHASISGGMGLIPGLGTQIPWVINHLKKISTASSKIHRTCYLYLITGEQYDSHQVYKIALFDEIIFGNLCQY